MKLTEYIKPIVDIAPLIGTPPVTGVRYNPRKIARADFERLFPVPLAPAAYHPDGYRLLSEKAGLGNHPLHRGGACYFQEPSAMSAVTALHVQNGDRVLDLCAAPGSKATALAAANPDGVLVANEIHPARAKILMGNLERMGASNALITNAAPAALAKAFGGYFDKILVDSPCSGEGMFRKYPEILDDWSEQLVSLCAARSLDILEHAAGMLRAGGRLVYSTCTFNEEENEKTVLSFLDAHPEFEVVDSGLSCASGRLGLEQARRIFPDENGEGHFVCALHKKTGDNSVKQKLFTEDALPSGAADLLDGITQTDTRMIYKVFGDTVYNLPADLPAPDGVRILRAGVQCAIRKGKTWLPAHHLFTASSEFRRTLDVNDKEAGLFLQGHTLPCDQKGFVAVLWHGIALGFGKASGGVLKNHFPKGLRTKK